MATGSTAAVAIGMIMILIALGIILFIFWDRNKVAIEYRDQTTGGVDVTKSRPKEAGVDFDVKGYPEHTIRPQKELMGTWHGSVLPWSYPLITIDPYTGHQFASRGAQPTDEEFPEELEDVPAELLTVPWSHVYWEMLNSNVVEELIEAQNNHKGKLIMALLVSVVVLAFSFLGAVWITSGGA